MAEAAGNAIGGGSVTINGDQITFIYPPTAFAGTFGSAAFNGYVITDDNPNSPAITGVSLTSTTISDFSAGDLGFGTHTVDVNVAGVTVPAKGGSFTLMVDFANQTSSASNVIAHPST